MQSKNLLTTSCLKRRQEKKRVAMLDVEATPIEKLVESIQMRTVPHKRRKAMKAAI